MNASLDTLALKAYELFHQERLTEVEQFFADLRWLLERVCQSPIEQLFLIDLLRYSQFYKIWIRKNEPPTPPMLGFRMAGWGPATGNVRVLVYPQCKINLDSVSTLSDPRTYRVDFLIEVAEELSMTDEEEIFFLVVELDGHDFHERTKEQAQRDKERDRNLTRAGYKVMRFTGSEVYANVKSQLEQSEEDSGITQIAAQVMSMIEEESHARSKRRSLPHNA